MDTGTASRAVRNSAVVFVGQIFGRLLDLWATLLIANAFGEAGYGRFSFAIAFVGYFAILTDLGFNMVFVKALVGRKGRRDILLGSMLLVKIILLGISIGLIILLMSVLDYPHDTEQLIWLMTIALIVSPKFPSIRLVYEQVFQAGMNMKVPVILRCLDGLLLVALIIFMIRFDQPLTSVMTAYVCSSIIGLLIIMPIVGRMASPVFRIDTAQMFDMLKQGIPVALLGVSAMLIARIDVLFLSIWRGDIEIGFYSAAYRLTEAFKIFPTAVMMSLYPLIVQLKSAQEDPGEALTSGLKPVLIIMIPVCMGVMTWAEDIVLFFYSPVFLPAAKSLEFLIWTELGFIFTLAFSQTLIALDRRRSVIYVSGLMLLVNLLLNSVLIPRWGYIGATAVTVTTELIGAIGYGIYIHRDTGWRFGRNIRPLLPAVGVSGIYIWLAGAWSAPVGLAGLGIVYTAVLWLTGGIKKNELTAITRLLVRKNGVEHEA